MGKVSKVIDELWRWILFSDWFNWLLTNIKKTQMGRGWGLTIEKFVGWGSQLRGALAFLLKRQKSESLNGGVRRCVYQEVKNVHFLENLACFVSLLPPFWDFAFLPYNWRKWKLKRASESFHLLLESSY